MTPGEAAEAVAAELAALSAAREYDPFGDHSERETNLASARAEAERAWLEHTFGKEFA